MTFDSQRPVTAHGHPQRSRCAVPGRLGDGRDSSGSAADTSRPRQIRPVVTWAAEADGGRGRGKRSPAGRSGVVNRTAAPGPVTVGGSRFDPDVPHPARVYNFWLGGKDHFPADRQAAQEVMRARPQVVAGARANRAFLARVVRYLAAEAGIRQFLDIGTGLPAPDSTHEVAQSVARGCRIVYVDNDPLVLAHARALLTGTREGACGYVDADVRDTGTILAQAAPTLDFTQPVAVLLLAILHLIPAADSPAAIVARLADALAPGSYVAISHMTADFAPDAVTAAADAYNALAPVPVTARNHTGITALFGGLPLVAPGVVPITEWRPNRPSPLAQPADIYAGLARTPARGT
jgi:S-adenosyl methyltransferase